MSASPGYVYFNSPVGWLLLAAGAEGISLLHLCGRTPWTEVEIHRQLLEYGWKPERTAAPSSLLHEVRTALDRYFTGGTPIPAFHLDMSRGTPFQRQVWRALCAIPFGETRTYLDIARDVGRPLASRAVGGACGSNPIAILVPCHRVVASGGGLGGYGGGLENKRILLKLEREFRIGS